MARRQSLPAWFRTNVRVTDGPQAGQAIALEPWQRQLLDSIEREQKTTYALLMASQVGKTVCGVPVALRSAVDGAGTLLVSATDFGCKDLRRRLDKILKASPAIGAEFEAQRSGPGARSSWNSRETRADGWLSIATAGSPSQLASRTVKTVVADELARWPRLVRGGEGAPLQLLEMRQADWGSDAVLIAISSPVSRGDGIDLLYRDGDRRRMVYPCPDCGESTHFDWEHVSGREQGETPLIACAQCGALHDEAGRRRMLRRGKWIPQRDEPTDEDCASFQLGRLDSARSSLHEVVKRWRKARLRVERGDPRALAAFRNTVLGLPASSGAADVDKFYERRERTFRLDSLEQVVAGCDVQDDRIYFVVLGFGTNDADVWVLGFDQVIGDPRADEVWAALQGRLAEPCARVPVSCVSIDAGYLTADVRRQCSRRRWWIPTVGRAGDGKPVARAISRTSGVCTLGAHDAKAWWTGRVRDGHVHLPMTIDRPTIGQMCAAEALTAEGGNCAGARSKGARTTTSTRRSSPCTRAGSGRSRVPGAACGWSRFDESHPVRDLVDALALGAGSLAARTRERVAVAAPAVRRSGLLIAGRGEDAGAWHDGDDPGPPARGVPQRPFLSPDVSGPELPHPGGV